MTGFDFTKRRHVGLVEDVLPRKMSMEGRFTFSKHRRGEDPTVVADFHNLITNEGLRQFLDGSATSGYGVMNTCRVGASGEPEDVDQTALGSEIAFRDATGWSSRTVVSTGVVRFTAVFSFPAGAAEGNVAEVSVGPWDRARGIFCRTRVKDADGLPTVIPVASDEYLTVTYVLDVHLDITDRPFTLNLISGQHDCVLRAYRVDLVPSQSFSMGLNAGTLWSQYTHYAPGGLVAVEGVTVSSPKNYAWSLVTAPPSEQQPSGVFTRDVTLRLAPDQGNSLPNGIGVATLAWGSSGAYQISFDPPLPKTAERTFTITLRFSVGRR